MARIGVETYHTVRSGVVAGVVADVVADVAVGVGWALLQAAVK